jgi:hypothetical protein
MRKEIAVLARRRDMTREAFRAHWATCHAALMAQRPGLIRYVQNDVVDRLERRHLPQLSGEIDGIEELWLDEPEETPRSPGAAWQDEPNFLRAKAVFDVCEIVGYETETVGRRCKRVSLLRRRAGMTVAEFRAYWSTTHLDLARAHRHADRYAQNHVTATLPRPELPETLGEIDGFGVFETADLAAMLASYATASGRALNEDAARFISAVSTFLASAREIPLSVVAAAVPVTVFGCGGA